MKTLHIQGNQIINITLGTPESAAPDGIVYESVAEDLYIGVGWVWDGENWVDPSPPVIPDPALPSSDWEGFNVAFLSDPDWQVVSAQLPLQILMGVAASAATANLGALQSAYNIAKGAMAQAGQTISQATLDSWQAIADDHNISIIF